MYPVFEGIAGPPCPGVYKYGSLALQVGGCATGRKPVIVKKKKKKKMLGNLNRGLETVSGKGLMRLNKCIIANWKERSKRELTGRSPLRR